MIIPHATTHVEPYGEGEYLVLYHVTTRYRLDLICAKGLDPAKSRGKRQVVWLVDGSKLAWAIAHCSIRHDVKVDQLRVIRTLFMETDLKRTRRVGVWNVDHQFYINPKDTYSARSALKWTIDTDIAKYA